MMRNMTATLFAVGLTGEYALPRSKTQVTFSKRISQKYAQIYVYCNKCMIYRRLGPSWNRHYYAPDLGCERGLSSTHACTDDTYYFFTTLWIHRQTNGSTSHTQVLLRASSHSPTSPSNRCIRAGVLGGVAVTGSTEFDPSIIMECRYSVSTVVRSSSEPA